jgi:DNA repair protein RecN (Recombination protein N)
MLLELVVENYAVVERLRVRFHAGLNILTGETGSGKSIVVDAVALLLGGRASAESVRSGAERARVSGIFEMPASTVFREVLAEAGIEPEEDELLVEREILANGKSRAFLNSRPVTATLLKDLALFLGDIHGQHDQQRLFSHDAQRDIVDEYGAQPALGERAGNVYAAWRAVAADLEDLDRAEQERLRLADLWAFQRNEISSVSPLPNEDVELDQERRRLGNANRLAEAAAGALEALYDAEESASNSLRAALRRMEEICRIDSSVNEVRDALKPAEASIQDASYALRDYLGKLEADPGRLEEVETRLAAIERLKRKYGATVEVVLAYGADLTRQLEEAETTGERREKLQAEHARLGKDYETAAAALTEFRKKAAKKLEKRIETELAQLAMEKTLFRIEVAPAPWSAHGSDVVRFLVSPNVGEEPKPLEKIASGGELSRIALALKTCIAEVKKQTMPPTLVFDEVDTGIGGAVAESVGRRLKKLAASQQVLCVTHLAQIAGFADHHYTVEKREAKGRISASIEELSPSDRVKEIGRMIAGANLTPEALKHAEQLLKR